MKLFSMYEAAAPSAAIEVAGHRVSAATLEMRGGRPVIAAYATEPLPPGTVEPSLTAANVHDRAGLAGALGRVLDRLGSRPRRVGLVVPDVVAKVSLVRFEKVPSRTQDLDQLVRWQVRKTAPFPIEHAQVSYVPGVRTAEGQEYVVSLAKREVIGEYEAICADAGAQAGLVDIATFNLINTVLASGGTLRADASTASGPDWLLVNVTRDYASIAIVRGAHLIFFRNRTAETDGSIADLVHQTAMYYEDRLSGAGFARVVLAGAAGEQRDADVEAIRHSLNERLATPIETIDPTGAAALTDRITASPALLDALAPLVGILLRDREAVA